MLEISAKIRKDPGKFLNALRKEGALPSVLYGPGMESVPLSVAMKEFEKVLRGAGETSLITVKVEGGKSYSALIHDVAKDPMTLEPIHADFYAVRMDRPIEARVPLEFSGESPAAKNEGGIVVKVRHELEVRALPKDLPHAIAVDLDQLAVIGDKIHVKDIVLPTGVSAAANVEEVVALVEPPRSEAELEELAAKPEEAAPAEVKTEREVKAEVKGEAEPEEAGAQAP